MCVTAKKTKDIAWFLRQNKIAASFYHAGLPQEVRTTRQEEWIQNKVRVIVSTNAFGMGIDKADVRTVVHMDLPDSLEAYFQEAGRGGRDGKKAYAILLYNETDKENLERFYEVAFPDFEEVRRVYKALGSYFQLAVGSGAGQSFDFEITDFAKNFQLNVYQTFHCLKVLEKEGWIVMNESVYIPSAVKIKVDKETLYDYQLKNKRLDLIIKTILRTYQGAFNHFVSVDEYRMARFLKTSFEKLHGALVKMRKDGIIEYRERKDKPQLTFLTERLDAQSLTFDRKRFNFLKDRYHKQIQNAIAYANTLQCRSKQLVAYFGEKKASSCGVCDVCLGRHREDLTDEEFKRYTEKITYLLKMEQLTIDQLVDSFSPKRHKKILRVVEYMVDEGYVLLEDEMLKVEEE